MTGKEKFLDVLKEYVTTIIGRNRFGNVLYIQSCIKLDEKDLRNIEKFVYKTFETKVTAFYKQSLKSREVIIDLDFNPKFPYDKYPLQKLLEAGIKK